MRAIRGLALILVLVVAACDGDGGTGTTSEGRDVATTAGVDETTSTTAEETTTTVDEGEDGGSVGLADMPQECIDALVGYLQAIEPAVEGVDFSTATAESLEALAAELERLSEEFATSMEGLDCPDPGGSDEEGFDAVIELAEREAPGTVAYLEWAQSLATSFGEMGGSASGDCETDIITFEALIDEKRTISNLTMDEVVEVGGLVSSITTYCSPERAEEFMSQEKVTSFLEG